jgi:hypothetical protein
VSVAWGAIVVTEGDRHLVRIFTGRDAVCRVLAEGKEPSKVALKDLVTADLDTLLPSNNAIDARRLMHSAGAWRPARRKGRSRA